MPRVPRLLALAGLTLALGAPAHADSYATSGPCGADRSQFCTGVGQGALVGTNTEAVAFTCTATGPLPQPGPIGGGSISLSLGGTVAEVGVSCYLRGVTDHLPYLQTGPLFEPGYQATAGNAGIVPVQGYELCISAGYFTRGGTYYPVQNETCFSPVVND